MDRLLAREREPAYKIEVRADVADLHPMARKAERILREDTPDPDWGSVRCSVAELPYVRVSPQHIQRAVLLLDSMCRAFQARGWQWKLGDRKGAWGTAQIKVEGEPFVIHIEETTRRVPHKITAEERNQRQARSTSWDAALASVRRPVPQWDFRPSNEFAIRHLTSTTLLRDTANTKIEEKIARLPVRMIEIAVAENARKRQWRERERHLADLEQRRERLARLRELSSAAGDRLAEQAAQWEKAQRIRAFLAAAEHQHVADENGDVRSNWLAWARARANAIDPLSNLSGIVKREAEIMAELQRLEAELKG